MSFFKKLFGKTGEPESPVSPEPKAPADAAPLDPEPTDPALGGEPIDGLPLRWNESKQLAFVQEVLAVKSRDRLSSLFHSDQFRDNPYCTPADAAVLFALTANVEPGRIMEIGCGYTTRVFRHAKDVYTLPGELIAVDPTPSVDIDEIVDAHLSQRVEDLPLEDFEILLENEILFIDIPHIARIGNGAHYVINQVLPALNTGVIVGFHGIRIPRHYTTAELEAHYNLQKGLANFLGQKKTYEIIYAGAWMTENHPDILKAALPVAAKQTESTAFWFRLTYQ